jgi:small subunit ribosomal protein S13
MPEEFKHIVRLAAKDLDGNKRVQLALADLEGVSSAFARAAAVAAEVDPFAKLGTLSDEQIKRLEDALHRPQAYGIPSWMFDRCKDYETGRDIHLIGPKVKLRARADIARERRIRSYRGIRHGLGLPVRGQRTRTTGRKGMAIGVKRKEVRLREMEAARKKGKKE